MNMQLNELREYLKNFNYGGPVVDPLKVLEEIKTAVESGRAEYEDFGISSEDFDAMHRTEVLRSAYENVDYILNYEVLLETEATPESEIHLLDEQIRSLYRKIEQYGIAWEELPVEQDELERVLERCKRQVRSVSDETH